MGKNNQSLVFVGAGKPQPLDSDVFTDLERASL